MGLLSGVKARIHELREHRPMVAAGAGNDHIQAARGIRPLFDEE